MAKMLFNLNNVEEDEANEVRELLSEAKIDFYETSGGRWRISIAAIWVKNSEDYQQARLLLDEYQLQRSERVRNEPRQTFWQRSKEQPVELFFTLLAVVLIMTLLVWPFIAWITP